MGGAVFQHHDREVERQYFWAHYIEHYRKISQQEKENADQKKTSLSKEDHD